MICTALRWWASTARSTGTAVRRFDAPSVFAAILDADEGGSFELAAAVPARTKQFYFPDTNVLITRFLTEDAVGEIQDFMPVSDSAERDRHRLIRRVLCVRGSMPFRVRVAPRFDYARQPHTVNPWDGGVVFESADLTLALTATVPLELRRPRRHCGVHARRGRVGGDHA